MKGEPKRPFKRNADRSRIGILACSVLLVAVSVQPGVAGPLDDFYKLEEQMADAQDAYLETLEAMETKDRGKSKDNVELPPDKRSDILKKMDALTTATLGKPEGASIATGTFFWSWNLDLDLENLYSRFERLVEHYPNDPGLDDVLQQAVYAALDTEKPDSWADALDRLSKTTKRRDTKIRARLYLGILQLRTNKLREAKSAFESILRLDPEKAFADAAKGFMYEIEHLQVGMVAPDFVTKRLDGKEISLKSLRGKVVLLDFWASWCAPCIAELPHLQAAAERLKGKPFEILGVSLDDERDALVQMIKGAKIPGTQTWDPTEWDDHPLRRLYNVQGLPTWYLVDQNGVIRNRDPFGKELIPAIESVLGSAKTTDTKVGLAKQRR